MTSPQSSATAARFHQLIGLPDQDIDLAEAALLIAKNAGQELDVGHYVSRIDELAAQLAAQLPRPVSGMDRMHALRTFLFQEQGFGPNAADYYDPRNSFLNQVIERRLGIPLSLSVLYMAVGQRIGLPLHGVDFPGHFLVKCELPEATVIFNPYSLGTDDYQQKLQEARDLQEVIEDSMLVSAGKKQILARMLRDLKAIYLRRNEHTQALSASDWVVALAPTDAVEVRDRGLLYLQLECSRPALEDLQRYLKLTPDAADADEIRARVLELHHAAARLN